MCQIPFKVLYVIDTIHGHTAYKAGMLTSSFGQEEQSIMKLSNSPQIINLTAGKY